MLLCLACGKPVPADKSDYVGTWLTDSMSLVITQDGNVRYKRLVAGVKKSIEAPIKSFEGNDFVVGLGPVTTAFKVGTPPYQDSATWRMVVDGVTLTKQK